MRSEHGGIVHCNLELDYVPLNLEPQPHASYKDSKHVRAELTRIVNRLAS